jgi:hypothetical protein
MVERAENAGAKRPVDSLSRLAAIHFESRPSSDSRVPSCMRVFSIYMYDLFDFRETTALSLFQVCVASLSSSCPTDRGVRC